MAIHPRAGAASGFLLVPALLFSGCQYARSRLDDLEDPWRLGIEAVHLPVSLNAQAAILDTGYGFLVGYRGRGDKGGKGWGFIGRQGLGTYFASEGNIVLFGWREVKAPAADAWRRRRISAIFYSFLVDDRLWRTLGADDLTLDHGPVPEDNVGERWDASAANIEVSVGILVGARAGVNPLEILDLVLGLATVDILGDDPPESPPEPPAPAGAAGATGARLPAPGGE